MRLLAVDPGKTSGYCKGVMTPVVGTSQSILELEPFQMLDDVDEIWDRIADWKPRYIVCEDFEFRQRSRTGLVLFSVQAIGVIRLYEAKAEHQIAVTLQRASEGKSYYTDNQLKSLGLYKRGMPHGMDALRHLLHWLTFSSGYQLIQGKDIRDIARLVK